MVFVGFNEGSKSVRYWDKDTRKIKVSRNVVFKGFTEKCLQCQLRPATTDRCSASFENGWRACFAWMHASQVSDVAVSLMPLIPGEFRCNEVRSPSASQDCPCGGEKVQSSTFVTLPLIPFFCSQHIPFSNSTFPPEWSYRPSESKQLFPSGTCRVLRSWCR